jgi:hypothetical protein
MGSYNILSKCDRALVAYLISEDAGSAADVYPAKRSEDKAFPNTVVFASKARLSTPHSGVWVVDVMVQVRTDPNVDVDQTADEKKVSSEERVSATFDALYSQTDSSSAALADAITAAARATADSDLEEFTVQAVTVEQLEAGFDPKTNAWTDTMDLELVVCAADVAG